MRRRDGVSAGDMLKGSVVLAIIPPLEVGGE